MRVSDDTIAPATHAPQSLLTAFEAAIAIREGIARVRELVVTFFGFLESRKVFEARKIFFGMDDLSFFGMDDLLRLSDGVHWPSAFQRK